MGAGGLELERARHSSSTVIDAAACIALCGAHERACTSVVTLRRDALTTVCWLRAAVNISLCERPGGMGSSSFATYCATDAALVRLARQRLAMAPLWELSLAGRAAFNAHLKAERRAAPGWRRLPTDQWIRRLDPASAFVVQVGANEHAIAEATHDPVPRAIAIGWRALRASWSP